MVTPSNIGEQDTPRGATPANVSARYRLTAIHEFYPRLPWLLYASTQALLHLLVMRAFARHLARLSKKMSA